MNKENTPENKNKDAVLDAFSEAENKTNEDFRNRWNSTVQQAQKRKEERLRTESMRAKQEEENRIKAQREAYLKSKHEAPPGIPLDLSELAKVIKQRAQEPTPQAAPEKAPEDEIPTNEFVFSEAAATVAQKAYENQKNLYFPVILRRDRKKKKSLAESLAFRLRTRLSKDGIKRFTKKALPSKGDSKSEITRKSVRAVSLVALVCALAFLAAYYGDFVRRLDTTRGYEETMSSLENIPPDRLDDEWARIKAKYPDIVFPQGMNIKFSELYAVNQNVVGWLKVDNTKINTVLLQADNNTYHLKHNIYNEYTRFGNPYVHSACKMGKEGLSKNTIFYGHNANDGLMFHDLVNFMTVEGYSKSPIVTLDTLYQQTKWKVFAVVLTNSHPSEDNGRVWTYLYPEFYTEEQFALKLREIDERTIIKTGVDVLPTDKIMTLYTCCTYQLDSGRLAVFARQIRPGEDETVDLTKVHYNSGARYPQKWYDRKGRVNPYASAPVTASPEPTKASPVNEQPSPAPYSPPATRYTPGYSEPASEQINPRPPEDTSAYENPPVENPSGEAEVPPSQDEPEPISENPPAQEDNPPVQEENPVTPEQSAG